MNKYSVCFSSIFDKVTNWTWQELLFGIKKGIIGIDDIINYTSETISEDTKDFDIVLQIMIVDAVEVKSIIEKLALKEMIQSEDDIVSKWIFVIIYYYYLTDYNILFDIIDDIYCEFEYPSEISCLVSYMPKEDTEDLGDKIEKYIKRGEEIWILNQ